MKKSWEQIHQELSEPFSHEDVEWKIQTVSKDKSRGLAVAYVTARAIQNRLDAVVGAQNWKPVFRQWHTVTDRDGNPISSQLCTIQIFDDERHEWMEKTDGAENTDYEPVKGGEPLHSGASAAIYTSWEHRGSMWSSLEKQPSLPKRRCRG